MVDEGKYYGGSMICDQDPSECKPGEINGNMKLTEEMRLDGGN